MELADMKSIIEKKEIESVINRHWRNDPHWIGGRSIKGKFYWDTDGSKIQDETFWRNFNHKSHASKRSNTCLAFENGYGGFKWEEHNCAHKKYFICEVRLNMWFLIYLKSHYSTTVKPPSTKKPTTPVPTTKKPSTPITTKKPTTHLPTTKQLTTKKPTTFFTLPTKPPTSTIAIITTAQSTTKKPTPNPTIFTLPTKPSTMQTSRQTFSIPTKSSTIQTSRQTFTIPTKPSTIQTSLQTFSIPTQPASTRTTILFTLPTKPPTTLRAF